MKRTTFFLLIILCTLFACNKDENPIPKEDTIDGTMKQGRWQVVQIQDLGAYYNNDFRGRSFVFNGDGSAVSTDSLGQQVNGTWYISPQGDMTVKLFFGNATPENRLNRTFRVLDFSNYQFRLYTGGATSAATNVTFSRL